MILWFVNWVEKNRNLSWLITIITAFLIFYISSLTFQSSGGAASPLSYIYHFTAFSYLTLFLLISLTGRKRKNPKLIIFGIILAILYSISDEIHQYFVPGRESTIRDILLNSIGIFITSIAYIKYKNH